MGWGSGVLPDGREVGYNIEAVCDEADCGAAIDRGLAYVCGGMHEGDEFGCGNYYCHDHLFFVEENAGVLPRGMLCGRCVEVFDRLDLSDYDGRYG